MHSLKTCTKCAQSLPLESFAVDSKRKDGKQPWCRDCTRSWRLSNRERLLIEKKRHYANNSEVYKARAKSWREENADHKREIDCEWRRTNSERKAANDAAWYRKNKDHKRQYDKAWRPGYILENKHLLAAWSAAYRARRLMATPSWADLDKIEAVYALASKMSVDTGVRHEVDHIVPLCGRNVCGLHVENNLSVITMSENRSKGNRFEHC